MTHREVRLALLDDHEYILRSIQALALGESSGLVVTCAATDPDAFLRSLPAGGADLAIVDLVLEGRIAGHQVIGALADRGILSLAFTADHRRLPIRLAMQAGARGLVLKSDPLELLEQAIWDVVTTGWAQSSALAGVVLEDSEQTPSLTPQELLCLRLASQGVPVKAIGRQFTPEISQSSVKTYLARAFEKYAAVGRRVQNTTQAAIETANDGWFDI